MKILLAADGSSYTRKALAFLVHHQGLADKDDELIVLNVQPPIPVRVMVTLDAQAVADYHRAEAEKVIGPIQEFLQRHAIPFRCRWIVGSPVDQILDVASAERVHLIVLGTHGHGPVARLLLGSVAQRVVARCDVPVLLVK
jgi:nucleotide-binding universal stress UspA family protein